MNAMKLIFKTFFLSLAIIANVHFAYAQSQGGLIPNGLNVFLDNNGKPLSSGTIDFYIGNVGSTTRKTTYSDINLTTPNTNPVILDAAGRPNGSKGLWGTGSYRQVVKAKNGTIIWDVLTSAAGSGSGSGSIATGDGDLVGTIKPWAGPVAPNQYMFTYGQELSRTTNSALLTAITSVQNVFCTSGSAVLSGVGDTTNFWIGMALEIPCVLSGATTVVSKTSSSVTMVANANVSTSAAATFFMWGRGNGTTTFNLPDFRGLIPMGNNIMGGVASSNISDTNFGSQLPESSGATGGAQTKQLGLTNLPVGITSNSGNIISGVNLAATTGVVSDTSVSTGAGHIPLSTSGWSAQTSIIANVTSNNTGSGGSAVAFPIIPPTKTVNYIIKVTPDANSATATGVTDIQGMTGSIGCISPIICTGNNISTIGTSAGGSDTQVQYNNGGALAGSNAFVWVSPQLTIGVTGATGKLGLSGTTSGTLVQTVGSVAGTPIITWGNGTGTPAVTASAPLVLNTTTGNLTITSSALTKVDDTNVTLTLGGTPASSLLAAVSITAGWTGTLAAGRLNSNVVQAFTNDTNVTASITAQNATLGWSGQLSVARGGTASSTALGARSSAGLNIDEATSTGDANYTILSTDKMVYHTALSAARTDTLPAANSVNAGQPFIINDFRGVATASNTITIQRAGADTVNGVTSVVAVNAQFGAGIFWSDGSSRWTFFPTTTGGGGGTVTQVAPANGLVSSTTTSCSQTAITTTGSLYAAECVNAQTGTSYAIVDGDRAKLITTSNTATQAYTIAQAGAASNFQSGWYTDIKNINTGMVTVTPTTSTINGASTFQIGPNQTVRIVSDGTNYLTPFQNTPEILLETLTASASASLSTSASWGACSAIQFQFVNIIPATAAGNFLLQVNSGGVQTSTYLNSGYSSSAGGALLFQTGTTAIFLNGGNSMGNVNPGYSGLIRMMNVNSTTSGKQATGTATYITNGASTAVVATLGGWWNGANTALTGAQFSMSAGNLTSGIIKVYCIL